MTTASNPSRSILKLSHTEAEEYFLKNDSYCNFDLPKYFNFETILLLLNHELKGKQLSDFGEKKPSDFEGVNYKILHNKDGKYAWRPLQLINPAIYVSLVQKITEKESWELIQNRFLEFDMNQSIECCSIPRQSLSDNSDKAEEVSNWWQQIEQRSIELALDYRCLTHTDLTDCYSSIYTHSIAWALHGKEKSKTNKKNNTGASKPIGDKIDYHLQQMSYGQTNGIPQGSNLMDFIAEMVLGYADIELTKLIDHHQITKYKILRYRDDYRIFSQSPSDNDTIVRCLTEVMIDLGLKLNAEKTNVSANVITGSIKNDKLFWLKQKQTSRNLQKQMLLIHDFGLHFPNSGSLTKPLQNLANRLRKLDETDENIVVLISIAADIAHKNPRTYSYIATIISLLLEFMKDDEQKRHLLTKVVKKFDDLPNTAHLNIWIQRVALGIKSELALDEPLCKMSCGIDSTIWNFDWLAKNLSDKIKKTSIIDSETIKTISKTITDEEVALFKNDFNSEG